MDKERAMSQSHETKPQRTRHHDARGFSLIEVIIAIGVLAGLLLSVATMFILGGRQLKTGKTITQASALVQDIMEEFDRASFTGLYTTLGAASTDSTRTVLSTTGGSPIQAWQSEVQRKLNNGVATVTIDAVGPGTPNFGTAAGIRLTVDVSWNELGQPHSVRMSTLRF
jgi:prepilin-type N-terminal cleavage/methylation domain-containing protein